MLLLWDIDGTLITMRGGARDKHAQAFATALGVAVPPSPSTAGKTDGQIMAELATAAGIELTNELLAAMFVELTAITQRELTHEAAEAAPGVPGLLAHAHERGWRHGLLTGNIPERAEIKLTSAGLTEFLDPRFAFTGQLPAPRTELGRTAAAALAEFPDCDPCIVIGDTPLDIAAARAGGFTMLSVATGGFDTAALAAHRPDLVVRDMHVDRHLVEEFLASTSSA